MRGEWQQVLCLLNEMQIAKIALNTRTVNEVMASFAKAEGPKDQRISWVFCEVLQLGVWGSEKWTVCSPNEVAKWQWASLILEILQVPNLISALASHNVLI